MTVKRFLLSLYLGAGRAISVAAKVVLCALAAVVFIGTEGLGVIMKLSGAEPDMGWWMALYMPRWTMMIALGVVTFLALLFKLCEGIYWLHASFIRWCNS